MKQIISTRNAGKLLLVIFMLTIVATTMMAGDTKISMKLWNRYTAGYKDGEFTKSEFALKRGYLRLEPTFSDKIKGRFNVDFFSDDDALDGAGIKLKYAYVDFKNYLPLPEHKISVGLIKNYFGTVYDWNYTTIEKALEDKEHVLASADYGIALYGYIPAGYGEYTISVTNGESYKRTGSDINVNPEYKGNVRVIVIPGVTLGGSILYENVAPDSSSEAMDNLAYAGVGHFAFGPVELWAEYLTNDCEDLTSAGFMAMTIFSLNDITGLDVDIIGRFDSWDLNTEIDDDAHSTAIAGLNWNIIRDAKNNPQVFIQFNWQRTMFENDAIDPVDTYMAQLRWSFSSTIIDE